MLGGGEARVPRIGEFELLVVLAILRQEENPFVNQVRRDLVENAKRSVTRGALYHTLDRLRDKGYVEWEVEPSDRAERGGQPIRRLRVTDEGLEAVRESREILQAYFEGAATALDHR
jgi:DNA-binding PadR family transcriptional regulator